MASRPDRPADEPSHDGGDLPRDHDDVGPEGRDRTGDSPISDEQWATIVADLRGDPDPTGSPDPETSSAAGQNDPRTSSGPAVTYPVAPWVSERRVVRPARPTPPSPADAPSAGDDGGTWNDDPAGPVELRPASGRDWDATGQMDEAERRVDETEHFHPADPGPVLGGDPLLTMAWLAVAGMPVLWLAVLIAWRGAPPAVLQASGAVFVIGVVLLLWRMPQRRDDTEHDDSDGAVV